MDNKKTHIQRNAFFKFAILFGIGMFAIALILDSGFIGSPLNYLIISLYFFGGLGFGIYRVFTGKSCKCPNCKHKGLRKLSEEKEGFMVITRTFKCSQCGSEFKENVKKR